MCHFPYWVPPASVSPIVGVPCVTETMLGIFTPLLLSCGEDAPPPTHTQERLWWSREVKSLPEFLQAAQAATGSE